MAHFRWEMASAEGHWNQIKREGEISTHLTASALSRNTSNGSIFVDAENYTLSTGVSSFGGSGMSAHSGAPSLIDTVRTQAYFPVACGVYIFSDRQALSLLVLCGSSLTDCLWLQERTMAEFADHGRPCHSPKYFGRSHATESHGSEGEKVRIPRHYLTDVDSLLPPVCPPF